MGTLADVSVNDDHPTPVGHRPGRPAPGRNRRDPAIRPTVRAATGTQPTAASITAPPIPVWSVRMPRFDSHPRPTPVSVGERAPDFRLRHTFTSEVSLSETLATGPVLLVFYVFDFGHY